MTVGCAYIRGACHGLVEELKVLFHLRTRARNILFHLVDEVLAAERHRYIHRRPVTIFAHDTEAVRNFLPVYFHAVVHHHLTDLSRVLRASDVAEFVE